MPKYSGVPRSPQALPEGLTRRFPDRWCFGHIMQNRSVRVNLRSVSKLTRRRSQEGSQHHLSIQVSSIDLLIRLAKGFC